MSDGGRVGRERETVETMIRLYCRRAEGNAGLCPDCLRLLRYAEGRLASCRFGGGKPACSRCPACCWRAEERGAIRRVMRWAGPRMAVLHPVLTLRHFLAR